MSAKGNTQRKGRGDVNVAENQRWKEQIMKEINSLKLNDTFAINPSKLNVVSKKPTEEDVITRATLSLKELQRQLDEMHEKISAVDVTQTIHCSKNIRQQLKQSNVAPRDKYNEPMTCSMSYGWFNKELDDMHIKDGYDGDKKWFYGKKKSDVTRVMN